MYRAILNFCLFRVPIQDRRIVKALICLCQSSTQACASSQTRCGIPNWFTSALLLWMTLQEFQEQASASRGAEAPNKKPDPPPPMQSESDPDVEGGRNPGEGPAGHVGGKEEERNSGKGAGKTNWTIFCPFVKQQCRPQVVTFLHIIRLQLQAEVRQHEEPLTLASSSTFFLFPFLRLNVLIISPAVWTSSCQASISSFLILLLCSGLPVHEA